MGNLLRPQHGSNHPAKSRRLGRVPTLGATFITIAALAAMDVRWRVATPARAYSLSDGDPRDVPVIKKYRAPEVEVSFDAALCIHSGECLRRLPAVFNVRDRPWVRPDRADAESVVAAVHHCPTSALKIVRGPAFITPASEGMNQAIVTVVPDGPVLVSSEHGVRVDGAFPPPPGPMVALCRCGVSKNFPYCDGSHERERPIGE